MAYINGKEILFSPTVNIGGTSGSTGVKKYSNSETYQKGDIVSFGGLIYTPKVESISGVKPTDSSVWENLTSQYNESISAHDKRLSNIESRLAPKYITTDNTTVYAKEVPAKACPYAQIDKLGTVGVPVKTGNLIGENLDNFDFDDEIESYSYKDGILTIKGTVTAGSYIYNYPANVQVPLGTKLIMPGLEGFSAQIDVSCEELEIDGSILGGEMSFTVVNGEVTVFEGDELTSLLNVGIDSATIYFIALIPDEDMTDFSVKFDCRIKTAKVTALEVEGANIIKFPYKYAVNEPYTNNGLTYTVLEDGGIRVFGVPTKSFTYEINDKDTLAKILVPNQTYTLSGCQPGIIIGLRRTNDSTGASSIWLESSVAIKPTPSATWADGYTATSLYIYNGSSSVGTYIDTVVYPVLNEGSGAYPYGKYCRGTHTLWEVPEEIQALEGYSYTLNGAYTSYIDFENKKFVRQIEKIVFDGTENWVASTSSEASGKKPRVLLDLVEPSVHYQNDLTALPLICGNYRTVPANDIWNGKEGVGISYKNTDGVEVYRLQVLDSNYTTLADWKAHLAELYASGNPLTLEYALLEAVETDISEYLPDDNFFDVEGAKSIIAIQGTTKELKAYLRASELGTTPMSMDEFAEFLGESASYTFYLVDELPDAPVSATEDALYIVKDTGMIYVFGYESDGETITYKVSSVAENLGLENKGWIDSKDSITEDGLYCCYEKSNGGTKAPVYSSITYMLKE